MSLAEIFNMSVDLSKNSVVIIKSLVQQCSGNLHFPESVSDETLIKLSISV